MMGGVSQCERDFDCHNTFKPVMTTLDINDVHFNETSVLIFVCFVLSQKTSTEVPYKEISINYSLKLV